MQRIKKYHLIGILFCLICTQKNAFGQIPVDSYLNYTQPESLVYNTKNIERHRRMYKLYKGKVFLTNRSDVPLSFTLYNCDAPEKPYSTTTIRGNNSGYCPYLVGSDWGIQFEMGGAKSDIFFLLGVGEYNNNEFQLIYYGNEQIKKGAPTTDPIENVQIGNQVWTKNNLNREYFRNGDLIEQSKTKDEWKFAESFGSPSWCYFNFDPSNESKYGKLYNVHAVKDRRMLAPRGYHIATVADWRNLLNYYGEESTMKKKIMGGNGWYDKNGNDGLFQADAGGFILSDGTFKIDFSKETFERELKKAEELTNRATWWAGATDFLVLEEKINYVKGSKTSLEFVLKSKRPDWSGFSIRCVKD